MQGAHRANWAKMAAQAEVVAQVCQVVAQGGYPTLQEITICRGGTLMHFPHTPWVEG